MAMIHELIPLIMDDVGAIEKSRKNQSQGYQFRGIDDVYNAMQPAFAKRGVFVVPSVLTQAREDRQTNKGGNLIYTILTVKHTFYAKDGSSVEAVTVGEAMDSGDKSANKAMSAAMKYAVMEVFAIPTEDAKDTENETHEVGPRQAPPLPRHADAPPPKPLSPLQKIGKEMGCATVGDLIGLCQYVSMVKEWPMPTTRDECYQKEVAMVEAINETIKEDMQALSCDRQTSMQNMLSHGREQWEAYQTHEASKKGAA